MEKPTHSIPLVAIVGPTASGKSDLAVALAKQNDAEIISFDSMQMYKGFSIGTGKITEEEMQGVPHHLIDICEPSDSFTAKEYQEKADAVLFDIHQRGKKVLLVGGTGLYLNALVKGLFDTPSCLSIRQELQERQAKEGLGALYAELQKVDPALTQKVSANDSIRIIRGLEVFHTSGLPMSHWIAEHQKQPPRHTCRKMGLMPDRKELYQRIEKRIENMFAMGWLEEVIQLREQGVDIASKPMQAIGYAEINSFLNEEIDREEMIRLIRKHTKMYAKRQLTWFRKEKIEWFVSAQECLQNVICSC